MGSKNLIPSAAAIAAVAGLIISLPAYADNNNPAGPQGFARGFGHRGGHMMQDKMGNGVFGQVTAVNGNTITLTGRQGFGANATDSIFTVDATNAKIMKAGQAGSIASIAVGDNIMAEGTVNGTNVTATNIRDGRGPMPGGMMHAPGGPEAPANLPAGNGQPVVAGNITSINGSSIVISNKSNVQYNIDASNAKISKAGVASGSISNLSVNDPVVVQGSVSGNSVVASTILDQVRPAPASDTGAKLTPNRGFFGGIGQFFSHMFGF